MDKTTVMHIDEKSVHPIFIPFYSIFKGILQRSLLSILFLIVFIPIHQFIYSLDWFDLFLKKLNESTTKNPPEYYGRHFTLEYHLDSIKACQIWMVDYALRSMLNNEVYFKFHLNITSY